MVDNDYISRAGIIAEYDMRHKGPPGGARKIMETFPAADVRPAVHGQWIYDCERTMGDGSTYKQRHCSECGYQTVECYNFCQHCGAVMDGGET